MTTCHANTMSTAVLDSNVAVLGQPLSDEQYADAFEMALEARREDRLFGGHVHTTARQQALHQASLRTGEPLCNGRCGLV